MSEWVITPKMWSEYQKELESLRAKLEKVEQSKMFTIEKVRHAAREQIDSKLAAANITIAQMRETLESVRRAYLNGMQHHDDCSCENCKVVLNAADIISTPLTQYEARVQRLLNAMKDIEYQLSFETYERMIKAKEIANEALLAFRGGKKV